MIHDRAMELLLEKQWPHLPAHGVDSTCERVCGQA